MSEEYWKAKKAADDFEVYWNQRNKASLEKRWGLVQRLAKPAADGTIIGLEKAMLPYSSILDVGCGIGNLIAFTSLATKDNYWGIDISPHMIERAKALYPGYRFAVADPMGSSEFDDEFSLVVAHGFLLHQHDLFLKLNRLVQLTGGHLIFDVLVAKEGYSRRSPEGYWVRVLGNEEYGFMKKDLEKKFVLEEAKFGEWTGHTEYYLSCRRI